MVSLINFKIVNEDLQQQQQQHKQQQQQVNNHGLEQGSNDNRMFVKVMQHQCSSESSIHQQQIGNAKSQLNHIDASSKQQNSQLNNFNSQNQTKRSINDGNNLITATNNNNDNLKSVHKRTNKVQQIKTNSNSNSTYPNQIQNNQDQNDKNNVVSQVVAPVVPEITPSFVVTWRNLRFAIEPKWHEKVVNPISAIAGRASSVNRLASIGANQNSSLSTVASKVVLDKLDGSFKSGELTAILGPSGAGKTTLLDCLTGHRKHGLSGSIKISSSHSPRHLLPSKQSMLNKCSCQNHNNHDDKDTNQQHSHQQKNQNKIHQHDYDSKSHQQNHLNQQQQFSSKQLLSLPTFGNHAHNNTSQKVDLKVSIIPQNDHLMGHLTVYETLSYASKMKNCFDKQFNHKLNIRRVAQQLGLMSCLSTRINKLSGGQYKRVSIAQELLSSPDILILDEPTSGLDAMTCYQTVQVLRKLTDDRQTNGQNQIAVILTIHQPNSDVFQQFNHVYVVAQGGKCIYEGSPGSIESVINRVGIRLPNSYYNPATMIVEIAAGKFGLEAIHKLNSIQKKQYDFVLFDEQNSTGDSAVDCPSSSCSSSSNNSDNDDSDYNDGDGKNRDIKRKKNDVDSTIIYENNNKNDNNNNSIKLCGGGLVNQGFVMDKEDVDDDDDEDKEVSRQHNNNNNNNIKDVIVIVGKSASDQADADSIDNIKMNKTAVTDCVNNTVGGGGGGGGIDNNNTDLRRKKRRRTRKGSCEQVAATGNNHQTTNNSSIVCAGFPSLSGCCNAKDSRNVGVSDSGSNPNNNGNQREKRLKLNSLKADQKFPFWRHTYLHFHRSWLSIVRDPMLCSMQLALHIIVPVMVSLVYGTNVGKPNACPRAGPMDIMAYALEPTDTALQLQEDLRTTLENIGYIFFKLYGIIFAAMTVTVLTFPLDMHVLVKEFRNGWYGLSSYFLGRTLADIPFQLTLPLLAMSLSYYATGQPYSYMQWRFLSITAILILSSLIAQSQGLLFGAILMDKMKAAVFVAPAATTPIILFAGFLVRTQSIPRYLRPLSNLSYLRYAIEACLISRYGFNQCECDPAVFNQTVPELPPIARSMLDYWLSSFKSSSNELSLHDNNGVSIGNQTLNNTLDANSGVETTTAAIAIENDNKPDLFTKLIDSLGKANSFGRNITSCEQVVPYPMIDYDLKDSQLFYCFGILLFMLIFTRFLTFFIVCFKVKRKV